MGSIVSVALPKTNSNAFKQAQLAVKQALVGSLTKFALPLEGLTVLTKVQSSWMAAFLKQFACHQN